MPYDASRIEDRLLIVADQFAALIAQDPFFAGAPAIPVVTERLGDLNNKITTALNKLGLAVVVVLPDGDQGQSTGDGLSLRVRLVAQIEELVLINQTAAQQAGVAYRPALAAAVRAMKAVHRQPNGLDLGAHLPGLNEFECPESQPFRLIPAKACVTYHVTAYTTVEI
ncbi:MAG: hypothetical protein HZC55_04055 [Verrucomicrobia bacterium]|nr:hypothetical protein [Verrucomicrobiota bacterium]